MRTSLVLTLLASSCFLASNLRAFDPALTSNRVGIEVLRHTSDREDDNLIVSPYSLMTAFAPLYLGAAGETRAELARTFQFPNDTRDFQKAYARFNAKLSSIQNRDHDAAAGSAEKATVVFSANRLFVRRGFTLLNPFEKQLSSTFGFQLQPVDFTQDPAQAAAIINDWSAKNTGGKIPSIVSADSFSEDTRLILANALYFKGTWKDSFDPGSTHPSPFHVNGDATTVRCPTLHRTARFGYTHEEGFQVISLPYAKSDFHCLILLPESAQSLATIAHSLTAKQLKRWAGLADAEKTLVALSLPKFSFTSPPRSLVNELTALGLKSVFDEPEGSADFSLIAPKTPDEYLAVSNVLQGALIAVDEEGTEAAAATTVELVAFAASAPRDKPVQMRVDRPFLFAIQHMPTGACLFLGRVTDPRQR